MIPRIRGLGPFILNHVPSVPALDLNVKLAQPRKEGHLMLNCLCDSFLDCDPVSLVRVLSAGVAELAQICKASVIPEKRPSQPVPLVQSVLQILAPCFSYIEGPGVQVDSQCHGGTPRLSMNRVKESGRSRLSRCVGTLEPTSVAMPFGMLGAHSKARWLSSSKVLRCVVLADGGCGVRDLRGSSVSHNCPSRSSYSYTLVRAPVKMLVVVHYCGSFEVVENLLP